MPDAGFSAEGRRCGTHPAALAVDTCLRCGAFVCSECLELLGQDPYCVRCFDRRDVTGTPSARASVALLLAGFGLMCGPLLSVPALILAWRESVALDSEQAPRASRSLVTVARVLGWVGVGLWVLAGLAMGGLFLLGYAIAAAQKGTP